MTLRIGERIRNRRKEIGISVDTVAEQLGKNRATVYRYESDDIENLPITILEPLAKILKTTPAHLMGWDTEEIGGGESIVAAHRKSPFDDITDEEAAMLEAFLEAYRANPKNKK